MSFENAASARMASCTHRRVLRGRDRDGLVDRLQRDDGLGRARVDGLLARVLAGAQRGGERLEADRILELAERLGGRAAHVDLGAGERLGQRRSGADDDLVTRDRGRGQRVLGVALLDQERDAVGALGRAGRGLRLQRLRGLLTHVHRELLVRQETREQPELAQVAQQIHCHRAHRRVGVRGEAGDRRDELLCPSTPRGPWPPR